MPFEGDWELFTQSLEAYRKGGKEESSKYFTEKIVRCFADKVKAGISIPNYPQFRDMNEMFLECFQGITRLGSGYMAEEEITVKPGMAFLPEVQALKGHVDRVFEMLENPPEKVKLKICVTGPYTLSAAFSYRDAELLRQLGHALRQLTAANLFRQCRLETAILALDEPVFGVLDDPLLDYGAEGREALREAWEAIFSEAKARGVETLLHLHDTRNELFWEIENLDIVESHVGDALYRSEKVREKLARTGKKLKVSLAVTDYDALIKAKLEAGGSRLAGETAEQLIGRVWASLKKGEVKPEEYLEPVEVMVDRLKKALNLFGEELVAYAGPECGLKSFPTYECALECLRRVAEASRTL
ncbi:MAG: uroporphyrinogen decarboxylase/cobalamine-independent methonine synthase family protein [Candidatus Hecatellaceae archaeon]